MLTYLIEMCSEYQNFELVVWIMFINIQQSIVSWIFYKGNTNKKPINLTSEIVTVIWDC